MATVYVPPKNDAYTVLLTISLGALIIGCLLLFMDWSEYSGTSGKKPPIPSAPQLQVGGADAASPAPAPGLGQPATPPGGAASGQTPPEGK
jgi:hypothetical protein